MAHVFFCLVGFLRFTRVEGSGFRVAFLKFVAFT